MTPISRACPYPSNDNLQRTAYRCALQQMSPRSGCKDFLSHGSNLLPRLRPRPTATTLQVSSSPANKRKFSGGDCPRTTKKQRRRVLQNSGNIRGQAAEGKLLLAKSFDRVSKNGIFDCKSPKLPQTPAYEDDKAKKRKRETSFFEDLPGSGRSIAKCRKSTAPVQSLTRKNLELFDKSMARSTGSQSKLAAIPSKRNCPTPTELSSASSLFSRAYSAKDVRFEKALTALRVTVGRCEQQPDAEDVKRLLEVMEKKRDSPEPDNDSRDFYEIVSIAEVENEAMVVGRVTPLLWPIRDLTSNNHKTKDLVYRMDTQWQNWGSVQPGELPTAKPDRCILFKGSAFTPDERTQMMSPYKGETGFHPVFICEVKTALQGPRIADRQNANNAISVLKADYELQQRLGHEMEAERKIRLITTAHNTRSQWYTGWFYVFGTDGQPEWCPKLIKQVNFEIPEENGFLTARQYNLNICEDLQNTRLLQLRADLAAASGLGPKANVQPSTPWETPPCTPLDNGHDLEAEAPANSKRAKVNIRSGTRSGRCYLRAR